MQCGAKSTWMHVHKVRDQLTVVSMRKHGAHDAGRPMVQRRHDVE